MYSIEIKMERIVMAVKVMADSTSYISKETREQLDIKMLPLYISFNDESIKETDIKNSSFYNKMEKEGIPKSSQPTFVEIYQAMVDIVSKGDDLLCVFLSSEMSGTYNSACQVAEKVSEEYKDQKIYILDSRTNCMQLGFAAVVAARAAKAGKGIEEVKSLAEENINRGRFLFIPDNLKYLKKGGRIGGSGALIGNLLKIIPILTVEEGETSVLKTVRTKKNAVKTMVKQPLKDNEEYKVKEIVVHHIDCYKEAEKLVAKIKEDLGEETSIEIVDIGPVIGMHVGPGAVGIAYYTEDDIR